MLEILLVQMRTGHFYCRVSSGTAVWFTDRCDDEESALDNARWSRDDRFARRPAPPRDGR